MKKYQSRGLAKERYKTCNMIPDMGFVRQLKALRKTLDVVWNARTECWEVWDTPDGDVPYMVVSVVGKDKTYKELSAELLLSLQYSISFTPTEMLNYLEALENEERIRREKKIHDTISSISKDIKKFVHNVPLISVPLSFRLGRVI